MADRPGSSVNITAREEVFSSDLMRIQKLASREMQNELGDSGRADDAFDIAGDPAQQGSSPISNTSSCISDLTPSGASFDIVVSEGNAWNDSGAGKTGYDTDASYFEEWRWRQQTVTVTTPDVTDPRIDLIVATYGTDQTDGENRNVVTDPVARTVLPTNIYKTNNPQCTLSVVMGTADPNPVPPSVPSGKIALYEVYVPALAPFATSFSFTRRSQRRASFPVSTYHGIIQNCVVNWEALSVDELASSNIFMEDVPHKVVIDGEVIAFGGGNNTDAPLPMFVSDIANDPFGSAAPGTNDKPYYIYAVGGRWAPAHSRGSSRSHPIVFVESLTAPNANGWPSSPLNVPLIGTVFAGALFVSCGWVIYGTTFRKSCSIVGDWIYANTGSTALGGDNYTGFNEASAGERTLSTTPTPQVQNFNTDPGPAAVDAIRIRTAFYNAVGANNLSLGSAVSIFMREMHLAVPSTGFTAMAEWSRPQMPSRPLYTAGVAVPADNHVIIYPIAYHQLVTRYGSAHNGVY